MVRPNVLRKAAYAAAIVCLGAGICAAPASAARSFPSLPAYTTGDAPAAEETIATGYADGTYTAEGNGIVGKVPVTVTIEGGKIVSVTVGDNRETEGIGSKAIEQLPALIVEANGTEGVDAYSGASITSKAIFTAVDDCLEQASAGGTGAAVASASVESTPAGVAANPSTEEASDAGPIDTILDSMTLDELIALRDDVDARIAAMQGTGSRETASAESTGGSFASAFAAATTGATYEFDGFTLAVTGTPTLETSSKGIQYVRVPITVTNNTGSTDCLNMFYVNYYGSKGTSLDVPYFYFDDELAGGEKMRSGASKEFGAYLEYDGNGDYYIELDNWSEKVEICVPVNL